MYKILSEFTAFCRRCDKNILACFCSFHSYNSCSSSIISHWRSNHQPSCTLWTEKNAPECLLSYLLQNPTDSDKIWYTL